MKRLIGILAAVGLSTILSAPGYAVENNGGVGTLEEVCAIARDMCMKACAINNPGNDFSSGLLRDLCERDCDEQHKTCLDPTGAGSLPLRQSVRKLFNPALWGMDGTPSTGGSGPAGDTGKPPADPGDDKGGSGGFDPGSTTGGGTPVFSAD